MGAARLHSPSQAAESGLIESFNGGLRDECLNTTVFTLIDNVRRTLEAWRQDYNGHRPYSSLGHLTPREFIRKGQDNPSQTAEL